MITRKDFIEHGFAEVGEPLGSDDVSYRLPEGEIPEEILSGKFIDDREMDYIQRLDNRIKTVWTGHIKDGRFYSVLLRREVGAKVRPIEVSLTAPGKRYSCVKGGLMFTFECVDGREPVCNLRGVNRIPLADFRVDETSGVSFEGMIDSYIEHVNDWASKELTDIDTKIKKLERSKKSCREEADDMIRQLKGLLNEEG